MRNTIFQRYSEIGATLSGGPKRYAPIYIRTDAGEVLLEDFANGFYLGMRLSIDDWKPHISNPEIGHPLTAILGHWTCNGFVPVTYLIMPPWLRTRAG